MADFYVDSTVDFEVPNDNQFSADPAVVFVHPEAQAIIARTALKYLMERREPFKCFVRPGAVYRFTKLLPTSPIYQRARHVTG